MVTEFTFPDVGEGVTEGTLIAWLVEEGDEVAEDESLAEVETDKAVVEVPAPEDGTILKLHAEEGDTINVGEVLVTLGDEDEEPGSEDDTAAEESDESGDEEESSEEDDTGEEPEKEGSVSVVGRLDEPEKEEPEPDAAEAEQPAKPADREQVLATPATRRLAREEGIDIAQVDGTGPGGRVTKEDVQQYAGSGSAEPETAQEAPQAGGPGARLSGRPVFEPEDYDFEQWGGVEREELSQTRRAIGEHMERAKYVAPDVTAMDDADVTELWDVREKEKEVAASQDVHLTFLPFIIKAVIAGLQDYPRMNASLDEQTGELVKKQYYNIGVAVATDRGLLVPVIKEANNKSILNIAAELSEKADAARNKEIALDDMRGGSFTVTNYGSIGGRYGTPILNYPEVGILGVGTIQEEPVVHNGEIQARRMLPLSLTFDHRVVDGAYAAQFMNEVIKHLEDPGLLLIDE